MYSGQLGVPYRMAAHPKGVCVIINNEHFLPHPHTGRKLDDRHGTNVDRDNLFALFSNLGFTVKCHNDLKDTEMVHVLKTVSLDNHCEFDCFVCCILSHGSLGQVYGVNGVAVDIQDLTSQVKPNSCPSLTDKPKVFFVQACQGKRPMEGYHPLKKDAVAEPPLIPNEADFLLCYSTVPGFQSYRHPVSGSPFIHHLVHYLGEYAQSNNILSIMTHVNKAMAEEEVVKGTGLYKMMSAQKSTLRFKLVFGSTPGHEIQQSPPPQLQEALTPDMAEQSSDPDEQRKSSDKNPEPTISGPGNRRTKHNRSSFSVKRDYNTLPPGWIPTKEKAEGIKFKDLY